MDICGPENVGLWAVPKYLEGFSDQDELYIDDRHNWQAVDMFNARRHRDQCGD